MKAKAKPMFSGIAHKFRKRCLSNAHFAPWLGRRHGRRDDKQKARREAEQSRCVEITLSLVGWLLLE